MKWQGLVTVPKRSILQLDALIAAVRSELGSGTVIEPEGIPVTDIGVPVVGRGPVLVESV